MEKQGYESAFGTDRIVWLGLNQDALMSLAAKNWSSRPVPVVAPKMSRGCRRCASAPMSVEIPASWARRRLGRCRCSLAAEGMRGTHGVCGWMWGGVVRGSWEEEAFEVVVETGSRGVGWFAFPVSIHPQVSGGANVMGDA